MRVERGLVARPFQPWLDHSSWDQFTGQVSNTWTEAVTAQRQRRVKGTSRWRYSSREEKELILVTVDPPG